MAKVLMKGNEAIAEAAIQAGCRHYFGYPITPQNEIPEYMARRMPQIGGVFLQAESEVAAINMVYGAAGAGARVMTSSSSPGVSLKQEGLSYIAGAEIPCVVVNMVRGGPGLGSIQPAQSDYYQATRGGGHGDYRMIVLTPSTVQEAAQMTMEAFDLADRYRMTVMLLGDGMIGQIMEPVDFEALQAKQPAPVEKPWATTGTRNHPGRNVVNSLYIEPDVMEKVNHACRKNTIAFRRSCRVTKRCRWRTRRSCWPHTAPPRASAKMWSQWRAKRASASGSSARSRCGRSPLSRLPRRRRRPSASCAWR